MPRAAETYRSQFDVGGGGQSWMRSCAVTHVSVTLYMGYVIVWCGSVTRLF